MRAYLLGYGFTVGPRVFSLLLHHLLKLGRRQRKGDDDTTSKGKSQPPLYESLRKTLSAGLQVNRFSTFCAALVGGSTLLGVSHHGSNPRSLSALEF